MPTAQWVETHMSIPEGYAAMPGRVNLNVTPYLRGMFDALDDPQVEIITCLFGTQLGKSLFAYGSMLSLTCQSPGPILLVMPTEPDARELAGGLLKDFVIDSPPARDRLVADERGITKEGFNFESCNWYFAWSNSAASLARRAIRYVFYDEVEKYPPFVGREADPIRLGDARLRTYRNTTGCKSIRISSPTTREGLMGRSFEQSDRRLFWAPCPECGLYQPLTWSQVRWPKSAGGHSIDSDEIRESNLAWYQCKQCERQWSDADRIEAMRRSVWVPSGCRANEDGIVVGDIPRSIHAGFQISALYSFFVRLNQLVASFLEAQHDLGALMAFVMQDLGEFWEEKETEIAEEPLRNHRESYSMGFAPEGVQVITCAVDVQRGYFVTETRGWGYGLESWVLDCRIIQSDMQLHEYLRDKRFPRTNADGEWIDELTMPSLSIRLVLIDARDQTSYIYELIQAWSDVDIRPAMGSDYMAGALKVKASPITKSARTKRAYQYAMLRYLFEDLFWKDTAARLAQVNEPGPGYMHLPADIPDEWFRQFMSERKVIDRRAGKRGRTKRPLRYWKARSEHTPNHYWDCAVLNCLATDEQIGNLRNLRPPIDAVPLEEDLRPATRTSRRMRTKY